MTKNPKVCTCVLTKQNWMDFMVNNKNLSLILGQNGHDKSRKQFRKVKNGKTFINKVYEYMGKSTNKQMD